MDLHSVAAAAAASEQLQQQAVAAAHCKSNLKAWRFYTCAGDDTDVRVAPVDLATFAGFDPHECYIVLHVYELSGDRLERILAGGNSDFLPPLPPPPPPPPPSSSSTASVAAVATSTTTTLSPLFAFLLPQASGAALPHTHSGAAPLPPPSSSSSSSSSLSSPASGGVRFREHLQQQQPQQQQQPLQQQHERLLSLLVRSSARNLTPRGLKNTFCGWTTDPYFIHREKEWILSGKSQVGGKRKRGRESETKGVMAVMSVVFFSSRTNQRNVSLCLV